MTHDVCGPGTIGVFKREFGKNAKVWDRNKVVIIPDHYIFTADSKSQPQRRYPARVRQGAGAALLLRRHRRSERPLAFRCQQRACCKRQYGSHYAGVCHTALPEKGHTRPGEILFGTDSHTCMAGAFNEFATGIGNTDAGFVMGTGKLSSKCRRRCTSGSKAIATGRHGQGSHPACHRRHRLRRRHLPRDAVRRPRRGDLNIDDRMTIANMAIEAGGKNGIFRIRRANDRRYVDERCQAERHEGNLRTGGARLAREIHLRADGGPFQTRTDRRVPPRSGPAQARERIGPRQAGPRLHRFLHRRQDQRFPGVRPRAAQQTREDRHVWRARHAEIVRDLQTQRWGDKTSGKSSSMPACR